MGHFRNARQINLKCQGESTCVSILGGGHLVLNAGWVGEVKLQSHVSHQADGAVAIGDVVDASFWIPWDSGDRRRRDWARFGRNGGDTLIRGAHGL